MILEIILFEPTYYIYVRPDHSTKLTNSVLTLVTKINGQWKECGELSILQPIQAKIRIPHHYIIVTTQNMA